MDPKNSISAAGVSEDGGSEVEGETTYQLRFHIFFLIQSTEGLPDEEMRKYREIFSYFDK